MRRRSDPPTPALLAPPVRFAAGFTERLRRLGLRASAARGLREGGRQGWLSGAGETFVGHRPYRPGEDLRHLDWELLARLDQPFVRVHRREASEHWAVLLDSSASMGLGEPGKLQHAAEIAAALAWIGARAGALVDLYAGPGAGNGAPVRIARPNAWPAALHALEGLSAQGGSARGGMPAQVARARLHSPGARRVLALGDLLDLEPAGLLGWMRPGRRLHVLQVLAPHELAPRALGAGATEWLDLESGERVVAEPDRDGDRYADLLEARLELWARACAHRRAWYGCRSSAQPFEASARALLQVP